MRCFVFFVTCCRGTRQPGFDFWTNPMEAIWRVYHRADRKVLKKTKADDDDG